MKKYLSILLLVVGLFVISGCDNASKDKIKTMTCTRKATITEGVTADLSYKVTYKGDYVKTVNTVEKLTSDNSNYLELYKTTIEKSYSPYKDVKHYNYEVKVDGNILTSTVKIDYDKIDADKLIEIDSANSSLIKNGKVEVDTMKTLYESVGATCK